LAMPWARLLRRSSKSSRAMAVSMSSMILLIASIIRTRMALAIRIDQLPRGGEVKCHHPDGAACDIVLEAFPVGGIWAGQGGPPRPLALSSGRQSLHSKTGSRAGAMSV
jgi:hypothetical protein